MKKKQIQNLDRRTILKVAGLGLGTFVVNNCSTPAKKKIEGVKVESPRQVFKKVVVSDDNGPIERTFGDVAPYKFTGDDAEHAHQVLWDVNTFLSSLGGKVPEPTEKVPVVIIGGGLSGLFSAYQLKKYQPVVLEQAGRFGGNSQAEAWRGIDYSIGAAYVSAPKEGSTLDHFYKDLDLYKNFKTAPNNHPMLFKGKWVQHFELGDTDPSVGSQTAILEKYFTDILENKNGKIFPNFPPSNEAQMTAINELDKVSFRDHIKSILGTTTIHPHVETWLEHYSWSTFGSSYRDISAAVGVYQFASEYGKIFVPPGGNAQIAEKLLNKLKDSIGEERFRNRCVVFQVKTTEEGVLVSFERDGHVKTILAESVVMACPKFVLRKIMPNLETERDQIIRRLRYNSYLVANVLINQKVPTKFFDLYILGDGKINGKDIQASSEEDRITDLINATYAKEDNKNGVLTLYRPLPYEGGRAQIFSSGAFIKYRKEFIQQIETEILPALNIPLTAVSGVRMARWGHAMPCAQPGMIRKGDLEKIQKPIENKIYFVNQDNWMNPCLEIAFGEAEKWSAALIKALEERRAPKPEPVTVNKEDKKMSPVDKEVSPVGNSSNSKESGSAVSNTVDKEKGTKKVEENTNSKKEVKGKVDGSKK